MSIYSKNKITRDSIKTNFKEKVYNQIASLCYREKNEKLRILLITSKRSRRWIIPKGWKIDKMSNRKSAALEAWEEAGAQGRVSEKLIGTYYYRKKVTSDDFKTCAVKVFALNVAAIKKKFPERGQRKVKWVTPNEAILLVAEPELKNLIRKFTKKLEKRKTALAASRSINQ